MGWHLPFTGNNRRGKSSAEIDKVVTDYIQIKKDHTMYGPVNLKFSIITLFNIVHLFYPVNDLFRNQLQHQVHHQLLHRLPDYVY